MGYAVSADLIAMILQKVGSHSDHPSFYPQVYSLIAQKVESERRDKNLLFQAWSEDFDDISRRMDRTQIQESCSMRNVVKTRALAQLVIKEDGNIDEAALEKIIPIIEHHLFSLGPLRHYDAMRDRQIHNALNQLLKEKKLIQLLKRISRPSGNKVLDQVIRCTLNLSPIEPVTDVHARRACLAAWMCTLRQSLGSCFATAPAIMVHDEQPHLFLQDISELFNTGRLK